LSLAAILEREGYAVDMAETGAQALQKCRDKHFDLALVDMRLPDMMGTDLLKKLPGTTPKMARIIVTGYPSLQNAIESVNEGADGYILKPVEAENLLTTIRKHLQKREDDAKYSEKKVAEYLETRTKELMRDKQGGKPS